MSTYLMTNGEIADYLDQNNFDISQFLTDDGKINYDKARQSIILNKIEMTLKNHPRKITLDKKRTYGIPLFRL